MLIECLIKRPGGTVVTIGDDTYEFQPDDSGAHVCYVSVPSHAKRMLDLVPAVYRRASGGQQLPLVELPGDQNGDGVEDRKDWVMLYERKFGKRPHHKLGMDKIRAAVEAD
jgi:hypothetical protein